MLLASAAFGAAAWCLAVVTITLAERLARPVFGWALACGTLVLVPALVGLWATRGDTSASSTLVAFVCGVAAWAWHEIACAPRQRPRRGGFSLATNVGHELAWCVFVLAGAALTWDGTSITARWTLPLLWTLHLSMRLNQLACERANAGGPVIRPPWFAPGLPAAQLWSAIFPLTVTGLTAAVTLAFEASLTQQQTGWALLAGVLAAGTLAHWGIVLRLRVPASATAAMARLEQWGRYPIEEWRTALRNVPPLPRTGEGDRG